MLPKKNIENILHVTPAVSDRMADAIQLWSDMYEGHSPWLKEPTYDDPVRIVSVGLPSLIASEKARMACLEMKSEINAPMENVPIDTDNDTATDKGKPNIGANTSSILGSNTISKSSAYMTKDEQRPVGSTERAEFLNKQYKKLLKQIRRQVEYGIAKGGLIIKPYIVLYSNASDETNSENMTDAATNADNVKRQNRRLRYDATIDNAEIEFDFIQADRFFPLAFDANGKVIEAAFVQTKVNKARERVFIRLEYHKLERHKVIVQNFAFESTDMSLANSNNIKSASNLGNPIPLTDVPEWASLSQKTVIENVDRLLFAYFRMPEANTVDPYSPLGVSGYSRVVQLIKDADMQYSRLLWEYEGGEMAIDVDRDALKFITDPNGESRSVLPEKQSRLFRKIDLNTEDTYNVFAPPLRDVSIIHGLDTIFTRIEDACGLSRGTISEVTSQQAKTATELKILKQRSYATNADIQHALQEALEDTIYVMDVYCTLYDVTPAGKYEVNFEWDDSILIDSESELSKRITLMQNGLASKLETRMWYFGETENQAKSALQQIDEESTQAMRQKAELEAMTAMASQSGIQTNTQAHDTENEGYLPEKSVSDTTDKKISKGKQADSLDNPTKSKTADAIKNTEINK